MSHKEEAKKLLVHYMKQAGGDAVSHHENITEIEMIVDCIDAMMDEKLNEMIGNNEFLKSICWSCKTALGCTQGYHCSKLNNYKHFVKAV